MGVGENARPKDEVATIVAMNEWLEGQLADCTVPHKPGKQLDHFCLETIWCKHQSHLNGHYPLYNDIHEINQGLLPWLSTCDAAMAFFGAMPPGDK
jgi:hypothetical protein